MMGIINNLLLQFVEEAKGAETRQAVLEGAGMAGRTFLAEQIYPEQEWQKLIGSVLEKMEVDAVTAQKAFARWCLPVLIQKFSPFFKRAGSAQKMLEKVPSIHRDFPSSASASDFVDKIRVLEISDDKVVYDYESPNGLLVLLEELGRLLAAHYGQQVEIDSRPKGENHWEVEFRFPT